MLGAMLHIKPIPTATPRKTDRLLQNAGPQEALEELVNRMQETAIDPKSQTVFISHGDCIEDAEIVADMVRSRMEVKDIVINNVGP